MANAILSPKKGCSICGKKVNARGLCDTHYKQHKRAGTLPERTRTDHLGLADRLNHWSEKVTESGCMIWTGCVDANGYGKIGYGGKMHLAHRLSYESVNGKIPDGMHVCHKCDTPSCVNPDHLFLGTQADNISDMVSKGRGAIGAKYHRSNLTDEKVKAIKADIRTQDVIANEYGVSRTNISAIKTGRAWAHVA